MFLSTVWFSFTIVCVSVSWKGKQSCDLHRVAPRAGADFQETACGPLPQAWRQRWAQGLGGCPHHGAQERSTGLGGVNLTILEAA